jgi:prephenate dehydrogenase
VAVVGLGLIGGSLGWALRRAGVAEEVVGCDSDPATLEHARALGVIDRDAWDPAEAASGADLLVVAVPVRAVGPILEAARPALGPQAVATDVGSVKGPVIAEAEAALAGACPFVGGHPIAGTEDSGVTAAFPELFQDALCVLASDSNAPDWARERVRSLWQAVGAEVVDMDPAEHDRTLALTSHMPHLLAYSLINTLAERGGASAAGRFSAGGFRDFTRIAASDPVMWRDIALANRDELLAVLDQFRGQVDGLRRAIADGDGDDLEARFARARALRRSLGAGPDQEES